MYVERALEWLAFPVGGISMSQSMIRVLAGHLRVALADVLISLLALIAAFAGDGPVQEDLVTHRDVFNPSPIASTMPAPSCPSTKWPPQVSES